MKLLALLAACALACAAQTLQIAPTGSTVTQPGQTVQFVSNAVRDAAGKQNVVWSVTPAGSGTITPDGLYRAPSPLPASGATATVHVLDFGRFVGGMFPTATATVILSPASSSCTTCPAGGCSNCAQYQQVIGLATDGSIGQWPLTLQAGGLMLVFRIAAPIGPGPCPTTPLPSPLIPGDIGKTVNVYARDANGNKYECADDGQWVRYQGQKVW